MTILKKGYLQSLHVVNDDEKAIWLIDYWCNKDSKTSLLFLLTHGYTLNIIKVPK